ncbi:MAG: A/G-specific adenine glycosylase [Candidatus Kapabacteria bacterium]|nr:A/G-specific adenine glycosylase [Candidatus Kapabacteria bacterium]
MNSRKDTTNLRRRLLTWYAGNGRVFPWRTVPTDPYVVLVSEVMLQQTQAARIAERLPLFLAEFPSIRHLAAASNGTMIRAWKGLGYNSRALRLRDAAAMITEHYDGIVPASVQTLRTLPGIGPYASAAIACFAYGVRAVVLDVNVRRVYSRWMQRCERTTDVAALRDIEAFAADVIPTRNADTWHHAVMDLGATICTARAPLCRTCPLQRHCPSANAMAQATRERKAEPTFRGEPIRLWRGRIVKHLSDHDSRTLRQLFRDVTGTTATASDLAWLHTVVHKLRTDGLVSLDGDVVSLPG